MFESRLGVVTGARSGRNGAVTTALTAVWRRRRELVVMACLLWVALLTLGQALHSGRLVVVPWLVLGPLAASLVASWPALPSSAPR